jgi:hypothetical protein
MKKIKYKILLLMILATTLGNAQENQPFPKVEEMHNRKWQFLVEKSQLSPKDADAVKPVFLEYEKALWSFHAKNGEFFKSIKNRKNDPTINYSDINDRYADIEVTQAQMFKNYHLKLRKILAPETLFKYYKAEREFKRKLLQNLQDNPKHGKQFERETNN